ncbi:MAG: DMT family transporter [Alphaproteobacteria bacterium]|nr:DMT family transporter [Alphaproteobacteria bacterium]
MARPPARALALLAALTFVWGTNWPLFRIALDSLSVWTFRAGVLIAATLMLFAIVAIRRESFAVPPGRWPALIAASILNVGIWGITTALAVLYIPSGHASVLAYTMPLWVALLGFVLFRQTLTPRMLAALALGAAAVGALMMPNFASYAGAPLGLLFGLLAGFCWALGTFVMKRTDWGDMKMSLTFWQILISAVPGVTLALLIDGLPKEWPPLPSLISMIYTGVVPMALGTAIWFALVALLPTQVAALASITVPMVAVASGVLILSEPLSALQAGALACSVASLWLALMPARGKT